MGAEQAFSRFWNALGGERDAVVIPTADEKDEEEWELMHDQYSRLYRYIFPSVHLDNQLIASAKSLTRFLSYTDAAQIA